MPVRLRLHKTPLISPRGPTCCPVRAMMSSTIPNVPDVNRTVVKELRKYGACDISDALLKLKVPGAGFLPDLIPYCIPPKHSIGDSDVSSDDRLVFVGPASTVLFIAKKDTGSDYPSNIPEGKHWADLTVTQPGTFVVISQPEGQKNAMLGGIMALRMKKLLAQGVVVHGRIRDISELKETGLMIWAKGTSTVGAGAESKAHAINVPITVSGITINPGDIVFSEPGSGVVIIPHSKVIEVLDLLPRLVEADNKVKEEVSEGMPVQEAFATFRKGL